MHRLFSLGIEAFAGALFLIPVLIFLNMLFVHNIKKSTVYFVL